MFSKAVIVAFMIAFVQARFGQEQVPIQAISDVTSGGDPGEAATIAGAAISDLLGAANPCDKLKRGDEILAELGTGADAIAAAIGIVAAEQNFNPSATDRPVICNDPTLPTNALLRGITPLVDPAVTDAATANALSASSQAAPFDADGLSVADILAGQGFTTFTTKDQAGAVGATGEDLAGGAAVSTAGAVDDAQAVDDVAVDDAAVDNNAAVEDDGAAVEDTAVDNGAEAAADTSAAQQTAANNGAQSAGLDFGKCVPTIKFVGGLGGRPATEFTFQAIDPLIAEGQQEALNPAIIVNRVCDQLTNVCEANDAAKQACLAAEAAVDSTQRNAQTAIDFNTALGFANVDVSAARRRAIEGVKRRSARY